MKVAGQFVADVQMGPVTVANLRITVADVLGDGLLGMDYLRVADVWIGAKEGHLNMNVGGHTVSCQLRLERQPIRRVARPVKSVTVQPMTRSTVRCAVEPPYSHGDPGGGLGAVAETVWCPPAHVRVPAALVPAEDEVFIPLMNYRVQAVTVGELRPIAVLDKAVELSEEVGGRNAEMVLSVGPRSSGSTASDEAAEAAPPPPFRSSCRISCDGVQRRP